MRWIRPRSLPQLVQRCSGHRGQRTSPPCWKLPSLLLHLPHERLYQYTTQPAGMWQWHPNVTTCLIIIIIIIIIGAALMPRPNMPRCGSKYLSIFRSELISYCYSSCWHNRLQKSLSLRRLNSVFNLVLHFQDGVIDLSKTSIVIAYYSICLYLYRSVYVNLLLYPIYLNLNTPF